MSDWFQENGRGSAVDVAALMDSEAAPLVWQCVQVGALVSIGKTSDGGALGVTVTLDGRWRREYFRDSEELAGWLAGALEAVANAVRPDTASSARRRR